MKNLCKFLVVLGLFLTAPSFYLFAQVGINANNSAPDASAGLDVNFNNKGFLPPRMTTAERNAIVSPATGLVIYNTEEKALNLYNGTAWSSTTPVPSFACGLNIRTNHLVSGGVAPLNKTVEYGTVNGIPGDPAKCWITRNLGASQQATTVDDATEASAGWYFQFNRKQGYQYISSRIPTGTWPSPISENFNWLAANDPCALELGTGWRIPTRTEWTNVIEAAHAGWLTWTDAYASPLRLHAAGYLEYKSGLLSNSGSLGYYWSSTQYTISMGYSLFFSSASCGQNHYDKGTGTPLRCLRDN